MYPLQTTSETVLLTFQASTPSSKQAESFSVRPKRSPTQTHLPIQRDTLQKPSVICEWKLRLAFVIHGSLVIRRLV